VAIFNVRNIGQAGVISDIAPWDLPDNALSDGRNFRVSSGKIQASGGSKLHSKHGAGAELGHIDQGITFNGEGLWFVCGADGIHTYNGAGFDFQHGANVNPDGWSTCKIGRVMFFNHPEYKPVYFASEDENSSGISPLPWSPRHGDWAARGCKAKVLASHRNFLFAMNTTETNNGITEYN
jgi:hypothetical protein